MNLLDLNASLHNLSQLDRHQQELFRTPTEHQDQNAQANREALAQRITMPVEPDQTEGKNIDPDDRRKEDRRRERRQRRKKNEERQSHGSRPGSGRFIDVDA